MKLWRISEWGKNFENNRTRGLKTMLWVPIPVNLAGNGVTELLDHPNGAAHLGVWLTLIEVAARCAPRGTLVRGNGTPHDRESLSRITRIPVEIIEEAMPRLQRIGWIEVAGVAQEGAGIPQGDAAQGAGIPQGDAAQGAGIPQDGAGLVRDRKVGREVGNGTAQREEAQKENLRKWDEFKTLYPAHRLDEEGAARAWVSREDESEAILSGLRVWVKSVDWTKCGGEYVKWASGFISNGIYKTKPKAAGGENVGGPVYRKWEPGQP
jgi:hypothetical protein